MVDYICKTNPIAPSLLNSEDKGRSPDLSAICRGQTSLKNVVVIARAAPERWHINKCLCNKRKGEPGRVGPQGRKLTPPANPIRVTYMGECVKEII